MRDDYDVPSFVLGTEKTQTIGEKLDQILKIFKDLESRVDVVSDNVDDMENRIQDTEYRTEELETSLEDLKDNLRNV